MDTNSKESVRDKNGKKFISTTLGTLLMILILAVVSVGIYAPIKDNVLRHDAQRYIDSRDFMNTLTDLTRYLIQVKLENKDGYSNTRYEGLKNIKYYVKSQINDMVVSNMKDRQLQSEISISRFYLHVKTDDNGEVVIQSSPDSFDKNAFINGLGGSKDLNATQEKAQSYLADLEVIYTVPEKIVNNNDMFIMNVKNFFLNRNMILILSIGAISALVLIIVAFSIPFSAQKRAYIVKLFNGMLLEFKLFTWLAFLLLCYFAIIVTADISRYYAQLDFVNIIYDANWYFYALGIPVTFTLYTLIYLSICYIKHVYHTGFMEGFIKNGLSGKLVLYIINSIKKTVDQIIDVDTTKEYNKKLLVLVGINLLVMFVIALTGGFGLVLSLAYTVLLFNYLFKVLNRVRTLNKASGQLAKGNFDIVLSEDMGALSPFSRSLNNIKAGFKVAVEEEVKSQNMRTQLISNVSHDLKTPLTSIITYVDLLKNEDLEKETQKQYIDILDKKSKRLKVLIEDLFEVTKASSGNVELHFEQLDVIALLRQTLGEMEEKINETTLQMRVNLPENKIMCELDGTKTYRVFENIISNILKYSMQNSRVYIDAEEYEKKVSFIFKNISAYEMNFDPSEITERFTRGDKSRNTEGSGLGLAIAKSLVELQDGNLDISIDGDLFKLTLSLPKA